MLHVPLGRHGTQTPTCGATCGLRARHEWLPARGLKDATNIIKRAHQGTGIWHRATASAHTHMGRERGSVSALQARTEPIIIQHVAREQKGAGIESYSGACSNDHTGHHLAGALHHIRHRRARAAPSPDAQCTHTRTHTRAHTQTQRTTSTTCRAPPPRASLPSRPSPKAPPFGLQRCLPVPKPLRHTATRIYRRRSRCARRASETAALNTPSLTPVQVGPPVAPRRPSALSPCLARSHPPSLLPAKTPCPGEAGPRLLLRPPPSTRASAPALTGPCAAAAAAAAAAGWAAAAAACGSAA